MHSILLMLPLILVQPFLKLSATAVAPADVARPNLSGQPVDYADWYRRLLAAGEHEDGFAVYAPYVKSSDVLGTGAPGDGLLALSVGVEMSVMDLLACPRYWQAKDFPAVAEAIERGRGALKAYVSGSAKQRLLWIPPKSVRRIEALRLPYLPYCRRATELILVDALRQDCQVVPSPTEAIRLALLQACQLSPRQVTGPVIQYIVSFRLRERTYGFALQCLSQSLLRSHDALQLGNVFRDVDAVDLRILLAASMAFEEARGYELIQDWYLPKQQRFSESRIQEWAAQVYPSPDKSLIAGARADKVVEEIAWYWEGVHERLIEPEGKDLRQALEKLDRSIRSRCPFAAEYLALSMIPALRYATEAEVRRRGARIAFEVFSWRSKHREWPRDLATVYPDAAPPFDPYAPGQSFVYRVEGANVVLYSVGPNGRDDGGRSEGDIVIWRTRQ